jgi:hypothetical protein
LDLVAAGDADLLDEGMHERLALGKGLAPEGCPESVADTLQVGLCRCPGRRVQRVGQLCPALR